MVVKTVIYSIYLFILWIFSFEKHYFENVQNLILLPQKKTQKPFLKLFFIFKFKLLNCYVSLIKYQMLSFLDKLKNNNYYNILVL